MESFPAHVVFLCTARRCAPAFARGAASIPVSPDDGDGDPEGPPIRADRLSVTWDRGAVEGIVHECSPRNKTRVNTRGVKCEYLRSSSIFAHERELSPPSVSNSSRASFEPPSIDMCDMCAPRSGGCYRPHGRHTISSGYSDRGGVARGARCELLDGIGARESWRRRAAVGREGMLVGAIHVRSGSTDLPCDGGVARSPERSTAVAEPRERVDVA